MLKYKVESLDGLDDSIKALYKEVNGVFVLEVDGVEDVSGLKNKNTELLGKLQREKDLREQLEDEKRIAEEKRLQEKGEFESLYKSEREKLESLQEKYDQERADRINQNREKFANSLAVDLSGKLGEKQTEMMKQVLLGFVKTGEEGAYFELGGFKVDRDAIKAKMLEEYPFLCAGSQASGGQAPGSSGKADAGNNPWKKDTFNLTEQARIAKADPEKAERLKASA